MLRGLLLALVAANIVFLAWSQDWLAPVLPGPRAGQAEPQRLANQVHPQWLQLLPAGASAARASVARESAAACLEAGPFDATGLATAQASLAAAGIPTERWRIDTPGRAAGEASAPAAVAAAAAVAVAPLLRIDAADSALQALLLALPAADVAGGFRPCRVP